MNFNSLTFIQAINELAYQNNIELSYKHNNNFNTIQKLYSLMQKICTHYHYTIIKSYKSKYFSYLKERGISKQIINEFMIGLSLPKYNVLNNFKINKDEISLLEDAGIIINNKKGNIYDRFYNRIIFPIRDIYGRVIAFGGRSIINNHSPKYLNSPETIIFNKSCNIYGLYEVRKNNKKISKLLLVEGYIDVLSLTQFGINYTVSILGTAINKNHLKLLYNFTNKIICCYDGDRAGRLASWATLNKALEYLNDQRQLYFMLLPKGKDPDVLIRQIGKHEFEKRIDQALPIYKFLFLVLFKKINSNNHFNYIELGSLALSMINKIPGKILKNYLRQQLGIKIGILDTSNLDSIIKKRTNNKILLTNVKCKITHILLVLIIQYPKLSILVSKLNLINKSNLPNVKLFIELVKLCKTRHNITTGQLLEQYRYTSLFYKFKILATYDHMIPDNMIETTFNDALDKLYNSVFEYRREQLILHDRIEGLSQKEKKELWCINQKLANFS